MEEIWKDIKGYEGYYKVSNFGRVKSISREVVRSNGRNWMLKERILRTGYTGKYRNYLSVRPTIENVSETLKVHRLVAESFIPNPLNLTMVNHKDGNTQNNHVDNLEWSNNSENQKHAFRLGLQDNRGEKHPRSILTEEQVIEIKRRLASNEEVYKIKNDFNVGWGCIDSIKRNKTWKHVSI